MSYNPFARQRSRDWSGPYDEESCGRTRSETNITRTIEQREAAKEFGTSRAYNTEPTPASPAATYGNSNHPSQNSSKTNPEGLGSPGSHVSDIQNPVTRTSGDVQTETGWIVAGSTHGVSRRGYLKALFQFHRESDDECLADEDSDELSLNERMRKAHKREIPISSQVRKIFFYNWITFCLIPCIPAGFAVQYTHVNAVAVFCINFAAIIPAAAALSTAVDDLSIRAGEKVGALLNMTFG